MHTSPQIFISELNKIKINLPLTGSLGAFIREYGESVHKIQFVLSRMIGYDVVSITSEHTILLVSAFRTL